MSQAGKMGQRPGGSSSATWPLVIVPLAYLLMGSVYILLEDVTPSLHARFRWCSWVVLAVGSGVLSWTMIRRSRQAALREAAALNRSQERYRLIADNATDVIWTVDLEGRLTYVSPSVERLRGYTPDEVIGQPFATVISPSSIGIVRERMARIQAQARGEEPDAPITSEVEQPCKDGSSVWVEVVVRVMRDAEGRPGGILGLSRNITKRRVAEAARRDSEAKFRTVFEVTPLGIVIIDQRGRVVDANPAYTRITGYTLAELHQLPDSLALVHPDEREACRAHFASVADGEQQRTPSSEWRIVRRDGSAAWGRHLGAGVRTADGRFAYAVAIVEDITQAKLIEERLRESQKMEAIGQLAGGVAHDFNNLLQVILGCTGEVLATLPERDPRHLPLGQVLQAAKHAAGLTRQLLAFSRQQMLRPEPLDLRAVIGDVLEMLKRLVGTQVDLDFQPGTEACPLRADRVQIEQVVVNLCLNARDAMPAGGSITVTTEIVSLTEEYCHDHGCTPHGRYAALHVVDTGVGMDEATLARVFEPFFTTKEIGKGTGLGLSVAFGIVSQHGGLITAVSTPGRGSTFTVLLPCTPVDVPPACPAPRPLRAAGGRETILLAEDEELLRDLALRVLQRAGYTVLLATHGDEAVELATQHRGSIDLLLLDVIMPRRNGLQVYDDICALHGPLPCVFVSGQLHDAYGLPVASRAGVVLLPKPYDRDELLRGVRQALDTLVRQGAADADGSGSAAAPAAALAG
jgi:PAS domain S-box-containing protein